MDVRPAAQPPRPRPASGTSSGAHPALTLPERGRLRWAFLGAVGLSVVLHLIQPWGRWALFPFAVLGTWAHEMGHGLCAILLGGHFEKLVLRGDLGGTAYHDVSGLARPIVAAAGLLGPAIAGGLTIVLGARSERAARGVLIGLTAALFVSALVWVRPLLSFGFPAALGLGVLFLGVAVWRKAWVELVLVQLIGIQLCLESLAELDYMFSKGFERDGQYMLSDTATMAETWLLPYWVWGALVAAASFAILGFSFWWAWVRRPKPTWGQSVRG